MKILSTSLPGVVILEPRVFKDDRGFFMETYQRKRYLEEGIGQLFVQDNLSFSVKGTLRGLHYQYPHGQAKLAQVLKGEVYDVAVDIRKGSPTFGQWTGVDLSGENMRQMFIPEGFAHGFCVTSEIALFLYKCSDVYAPECESGILWSDPELGITWPFNRPMLSKKDANYGLLKDIPIDRLPRHNPHTSPVIKEWAHTGETDRDVVHA
jgi:dTDP-4-dehydrorhamnose 3,5-epimerase